MGSSILYRQHFRDWCRERPVGRDEGVDRMLMGGQSRAILPSESWLAVAGRPHRRTSARRTGEVEWPGAHGSLDVQANRLVRMTLLGMFA